MLAGIQYMRVRFPFQPDNGNLLNVFVSVVMKLDSSSEICEDQTVVIDPQGSISSGKESVTQAAPEFMNASTASCNLLMEMR